MFFSQVRFETGVVFPLSPKAVYKPKAATSPSPGSGRKKKGRPRVIRDIEDADAADFSPRPLRNQNLLEPVGDRLKLQVSLYKSYFSVHKMVLN